MWVHTAPTLWTPRLRLFMGWFRSKKEAEQATLVSSMAKAFAEALAGVLTAQGKQIEQSSAFLGQLQDLSARKASQILGSRGGRETQKRKKKLREAAEAIQCRLCTNPMARGVTLQELDEHRRHEGAVRDAQLPPPGPETPEVGN